MIKLSIYQEDVMILNMSAPKTKPQNICINTGKAEKRQRKSTVTVGDLNITF